LPVEAQAISRAPSASARETAIALARSLNDAEAMRVSSFMRTRPTSSAAARRGASSSGVQPVSAGSAGAPSGSGSSSR
jgi:hypothetical protein